MKRVLHTVLLTTVLAGSLIGPVLAQTRAEARAAYLRAIGLDQQARALEKVLVEKLEAGGTARIAASPEDMAAFFAFFLTISGITAEKAEKLEAGGVDLLHAITADTRPFKEQALLADLVVVGEVVALADTPAPGDGFRSSITVRVRKPLKGAVPGDTIVIRQRSLLTSEEDQPNARSRDLKPETGQTYLFLLSNGLYRFGVTIRAPREAVPEAVKQRHYVIYRWYRMEYDRLIWRRFNRQDTERAFEEIRWLDDLLKSL